MRESIKSGLFAAAPFWIAAVIVVCLGAFLIDLWIPVCHPPFSSLFSWEGVGMFIVICGGLGWVFHGTGFLLVKVN